ncbi:MAG TPA: hypothetical protein VHQ02_12580 [Usitatibacter sp.]|jgi:hypothetical protein|nr:hypothetical protein [Usitatibacter sp.]
MDARVDFGDRPESEASLAPIYAAIGVLMAAALVGFAIALWPQGSGAAAAEAPASNPAPAVFDRAPRIAPDGSPHARKWI